MVKANQAFTLEARTRTKGVDKKTAALALERFREDVSSPKISGEINWQLTKN